MALFARSEAQATLAISSAATQNITCSGNICSPTAKNAILNAKDLEKLLASGGVTVTTTGSGVEATNLSIAAGVSWSNHSSLALEAFESISVEKAISVNRRGGLSLLTNNGGSDGTLSFGSKGHVQFKKLLSTLSINGTAYTLVDSVSTLANAIGQNASGAFAFARAYDASGDGTYTSPPVNTTFEGSFEGLGNTISNLSVNDSTDFYVGFFAENVGVIGDIELSNANLTASSGLIGVLVGENEGTVRGSRATGTLTASSGTAGGLVGCEGFAPGTIASSSANVTVNDGGDVAIAGGLLGSDSPGSAMTGSFASGSVSAGTSSYAGGLNGVLEGSIDGSYATGAVTAGGTAAVGGLVGNSSAGTITNSYATGAVSGGSGQSGTSYIGGLIGQNFGTIAKTYSTGAVSGIGTAFLGGLAGDDYPGGGIASSYWDTTTSGITNLSQGAGNQPNDPGITGLTTEQLQSGLPKGISRKVWKESGNRNAGLPYLIDNPPS
jgi:hypothetical protein